MENVYLVNNLEKGGSLKVTMTPAQPKTLTHLPKRPPVDLAFTDLTYKVQEGRKSSAIGRPKDQRVWQHYRPLENKSVSCKYCEKFYKFSHVGKMVKHLIACLNCPETVKNYMKTIRDDSCKRKNHLLPQKNDALPQKNDALPEKTDVLPQRKETRMSTSSSTNSDTCFQTSDEIDLITQLAKAIFVSGAPLSMVEHPLWIQFFEKLQPSFKIPSRKTLSTEYLEKIYREIRLELDEELYACNYLHLQCDGWSDLRNKGVINFLISKPQPAYIKSLNAEADSHTSEYLSQEIEKIITMYGEKKFLVLIGDNARNIQKAFELIKLKYSHVVPLVCCAHILNLLCQDILKVHDLNFFMTEVSNIITTVKKSQQLNLLLKNICQNPDTTRTLKLPCDTRWGSHVTALKSLETNKLALQRLVHSSDVVIAKDIKKLILNHDFWRKTNECISILEPITKSILNLEGDQFRIHQTYTTFKDIQSKIDFVLPNISMLNEEGKQQILSSVAETCKMSVRPIHLAAYMLDPRVQGAELTQEEELLAMEFIHVLGQQLSLLNVMTELACYKAKENFWSRQFIWNSATSIEPIVWWKGICGTTELSKVAIRILSAPCTSAATERSFSIQEYIHNNTRNRFSTHAAAKVSFICYNWNLKHKLNGEDEESEEESCTDPITDDAHVPSSSTSDEVNKLIHFVACNYSVQSDSD